MNNFYLTLLSDSSLSIFSKNTQCDFKVKLDHSIQIEKDNWEVGLVEVITPTEVSKVAKIRNRYNQVPHLTQDTNGKVTNSQKTPQTRAKRSALSQQVTTKHI